MIKQLKSENLNQTQNGCDFNHRCYFIEAINSSNELNFLNSFFVIEKREEEKINEYGRFHYLCK